MLFNSWKFLVFFPAVTAFYFLSPHRCRWSILLAASLFFYMLFSPYHIIIAGAMVLVNYGAGIYIDRLAEKKKKALLIAGMAANILFLFVFKYFNFFLDSVSAVTFLFNVKVAAGALKIIIPVGISYITFQVVSYLIEVYRGKQAAERHFGIFALSVLFFPKILSGPIERPQDLLHQFHERHDPDAARIADGLKLMAWGFFKKIVVADRLAIIVNHVYGRVGEYSGFPLFLTVIIFAFQLYYDFSGYTDIALGSARVLGIRLTQNFDRPYNARSLTDFWRRWHISLSTWIRDYLYTPIVINRRYWGKAGVVFALMAAFTLCGLWHGASWNFVIFGAINGLGLSLEFLVQKRRKKLEERLPKFLSAFLNIGVTFFFFAFSLIFFRAATVSESFYVITHLFTNFWQSMIIFFTKVKMLNVMGLGDFEFKIALISIVIVQAVDFIQRRGPVCEQVSKQPAWKRLGLYYLLLMGIALFGVYSGKVPFIYFNF